MGERTDATVEIHGKNYKIVAARVAEFRDNDKYAGWASETEIFYQDEAKVIVTAKILDYNKELRSTGMAEEYRDASNINKTSALECAETSAVGRALAFLDSSLMGTEIRSADEMANAVEQQMFGQLVEYNGLVREFWPSINAVKDYLEPKWGENENQHHVTEARAVLKELGDDISKALWKAPTNGGIFTTNERTLLKEPPEDSL